MATASPQHFDKIMSLVSSAREKRAEVHLRAIEYDIHEFHESSLGYAYMRIYRPKALEPITRLFGTPEYSRPLWQFVPDVRCRDQHGLGRDTEWRQIASRHSVRTESNADGPRPSLRVCRSVTTARPRPGAGWGSPLSRQ